MSRIIFCSIVVYTVDCLSFLLSWTSVPKTTKYCLESLVAEGPFGEDTRIGRRNMVPERAPGWRALVGQWTA